MKSFTTQAFGVFSLAALVSAAGPAFAQSTVTAADHAFLMKASQANIGEIASGKLAQQKAMSPDTRSLGKRFVDNHSDNQQKLAMLAKKLNVMLPMHPAADDVMVMAKLNTMSGAEFDSTYLDVEQKDHMKNIAAFKHEAMATKNPMIMAYVKASIPVLEEHLTVATDDAAKMHRMGAMGNVMGGSHTSDASSMNSGSMGAGANSAAHSPVSSGLPGTPASTGAGGTAPNAAGSSSGSATSGVGNGAGPNGPTGGGAGSVPQPGTPPQR